MSTTSLITALEKLIKLHKSLNELAGRKTDIIKLNDMNALKTLLNDEQKSVKAIEMIEKERLTAVMNILQSNEMKSSPTTVTTMIQVAESSEKGILEQLKEELLQEVASLKEVNRLNQQLIYQSLQFINTSLDLFRPRRQQNFNYNKPTQKEQQHTRRIFDSQV